MRFGYRLVRWTSQGLFRTLYGLRVYGIENIPQTGAVIIASNHRSNFDPPLHGGVVMREVHYFAKEELFRSRGFGGFIRYLNAFPVRRGQFDRTALSQCLDVLERSGCLLFFPEGTRAPNDGFLSAKLGVGWVASLSGAQIVPAYIHGSTVSRPTLLGRPRISIIYGEAFGLSSLKLDGLRGKELYAAISDQILEKIRDVSLRLPGGLVKAKGPVYERSVIDEERLR